MAAKQHLTGLTGWTHKRAQEGLVMTPERAILNEYLCEVEQHGGAGKNVVHNYKEMLLRYRNKKLMPEWLTNAHSGYIIPQDPRMKAFLDRQDEINATERASISLEYEREMEMLWREVAERMNRGFDGQNGFDNLAIVWFRIQRLGELYGQVLGKPLEESTALLWQSLKQSFRVSIPPFDPDFHGLRQFDPILENQNGNIKFKDFNACFNGAVDKSGQFLNPLLKDGLKSGVGAWFYSKGWYMDPDTGTLSERKDFTGTIEKDVNRLNIQLKSELNHFLTNAANMSIGDSFKEGMDAINSVTSPAEKDKKKDAADSTPSATPSSP